MIVWKPLFDAERNRQRVRDRKEYFEQLNLNLVHTGILPNLGIIRDWDSKWGDWREWECDQQRHDKEGYCGMEDQNTSQNIGRDRHLQSAELKSQLIFNTMLHGVPAIGP